MSTTSDSINLSISLCTSVEFILLEPPTVVIVISSLYDFIIGSQMVMEMAPKTMTGKQIDEFQKALTWFRQNNPEAYYVLLD